MGELFLPNLEKKLVSIRRKLHQYPELSNEEFETTNDQKSWLEEVGIEIVESSLKTGVIAEISGKKKAPIVAVRADIDALPITEETGLSFASKIHGKMHACGHDYHTAALIGAAYLLKQKECDLKGTVRFIFQPAEEIGGGALKVLASGALKNVSAILGLHNKPDLPVGTVGIKSGALMASVDHFEIKIEGIGTHAAVPHAGIDPIVTASEMIMALQTIVSRKLSPFHNVVISVAQIRSGHTWNVISNSAHLEGTVRTFQEDIREKIPGLMKQIIEGVAVAHGARAVLRWYPGPPPVNNDEKLTKLAIKTAEKLKLKVVDPIPSMAGEDFAFYQKEVPSSFVFMGTSGTKEWHHPAFTLDERALSISAHYLKKVAVSTLTEFNVSSDDDGME
ncbi:amidohydrolase [Bacillus aquiflavi]|uniref:amidohydrolase n=1 Tax=Bacillus aquiflavi TaxID=2672567 RepID=UPI001CA94750|nr:amidohydrolase [Bacillus aquiflavi]UAC49817.1 amidohydrolase [Bacillus aquiflavi]